MRVETKKVIIRNFEIKDLVLYKKWNIGNHKWMKFDGPYYPKMTIEELNSRITTIRDNILSENITPRIIIADIESDNLIGTLSWYWQSEETNWLSVGIAIYDDSFWGKGLGFDSLKIYVDYIFNIKKAIVRIDLRTWSGNFGMINLAKKLNFKEEAIFRKARIVDGKYYDSLAYGILREEWEK